MSQDPNRRRCGPRSALAARPAQPRPVSDPTMKEDTNMSLDYVSSTSRLGKPMHDELVPSRYALKVGDIDVMVISDGVLSLPTAVLVATADPAARAAVL